ncbi:GDP-L-galactose phosphorylase 1-like isoform X2 [Macadamia integrifolia]|uniref:GDP-L-galactose phosphorylase 1-like isoform X2 n=1 Tax=Macadamia integrifolia TaxID=60698 RepID=UPI001C4FE2E3|nr:GDP-L-galactose phosphorylase 1-like isoform X2 [Macadamia integrifolia]
MFTVNQFEDDYCMLKYDAASEHSQVPWMPLQGTKIPLYWLGSRSALDNGACGRLSCTPTEDQTLLDSLFLAQWEDCAWKGFLRYDVTACELKVIDGRRNFVAQLNEGWNLNNFLKQNPFTSKCMKMHREWLLFGIASGEQTNPKIIHSATIPDGASLVIVNANPVEYGHVFLVPRGLNSLSQLMDARALEMVARVSVEINNSSFRVFYDYSSSANHPYFQACYFANPLPVELMSVVAIHGGQKLEGLHIYEVKDYPVKAFLFIGNGNLKILIEVVVNICSWLQDQMVPYSMLISDCGTKMYLFPKIFGGNTCVWIGKEIPALDFSALAKAEPLNGNRQCALVSCQIWGCNSTI